MYVHACVHLVMVILLALSPFYPPLAPLIPDLGLIGGAMHGITEEFHITDDVTVEAIVGAAKLGVCTGAKLDYGMVMGCCSMRDSGVLERTAEGHGDDTQGNGPAAVCAFARGSWRGR